VLFHNANPLCIGYFLDKISLFYAWAGLDFDSPTYSFCIAGMTDMCHLAQLLLVEMGSHELFLPGLA
jgi:hypothetical protein